MSFPYAEIEKKLGYVFLDKALLQRAFTHSTYPNKGANGDNERLEYLGDAVLDCVIAERQCAQDKKATPGQMTKERAKIVCQSALDSATDGLGVWQYLLYKGTRENLKGKPKSSLFEAIVGAIFTDGGYEQAKAFIERHGILRAPINSDNPKGELQEFLQARGERVPDYNTRKTGGMDNAPIFHCTVRAMNESAEGEGGSKREAEQIAASRLLHELSKRKGTSKK